MIYPTTGDRNFPVHRNPVHRKLVNRNFSGPPESCAPETVLDFLFWVQLQTKKGFENFYIDESVCPFHHMGAQIFFLFFRFFLLISKASVPCTYTELLPHVAGTEHTHSLTATCGKSSVKFNRQLRHNLYNSGCTKSGTWFALRTQSEVSEQFYKYDLAVAKTNLNV